MSIESSFREYFHAAAQRLTEPADSLFDVYRRARRRRAVGLTIIAIAAVIALAVAVGSAAGSRALLGFGLEAPSSP